MADADRTYVEEYMARHGVRAVQLGGLHYDLDSWWGLSGTGLVEGGLAGALPDATMGTSLYKWCDSTHPPTLVYWTLVISLW